MKFLWHDMAWAGYVEWQRDKKILKRINNLLKAIYRNGYNSMRHTLRRKINFDENFKLSCNTRAIFF